MATHTRIWITLLAFLVMALPVTADTRRATIETEIVDNDKKHQDTDIITIDGDKKLRLDFLGEEMAGLQIEAAIQNLLVNGRIPSLDARSGLQTDEVGNMVAEELARQETVPG